MHSLVVTRHRDTIIVTLRANAFLQHMVRNIVGCLVYIGTGRNEPAWMAEVLAGRDRNVAAPTGVLPDSRPDFRMLSSGKNRPQCSRGGGHLLPVPRRLVH